MLSEQFIEKLKTIAKHKSWEDKMIEKDKMVENFAGSNVDDAFDGGYRSGETAMARSILKELNITY